MKQTIIEEVKKAVSKGASSGKKLRRLLPSNADSFQCQGLRIYASAIADALSLHHLHFCRERGNFCSIICGCPVRIGLSWLHRRGWTRYRASSHATTWCVILPKASWRHVICIYVETVT